MIIIAETVKNVNILIRKSEYFLDEAIKYKYEYETLSNSYFETYQHLRNAIDDLHSELVKFINTQSAKKDIKDEVLKTMKNVWTFEHSQYIEKIEYLNNKELLYSEL